MGSPAKHTTLSTPARAQKPVAPPMPRQYVSFAFYQLLPSWWVVPRTQRKAATEAFRKLVEAFRGQGILILTFSTAGLKADADCLVWRVAPSLDPLEEMSARIAGTGLGGHLRLAYSYLSMTRRSIYVDKLDPDHQERRLAITPAHAKYFFVYPFVKTRAWYALPQAERQAMMDEHIVTGNRYPSVRLHTTYSFGLDDQEFVVAFETDRPEDFLDLVMELRAARASQYTLRDTPIFTCVARPLEELLTRWEA